MNKIDIYKNIAKRPFSATQMVWNHRRTLLYLARKGRCRNLYNNIFTSYFIRGEDCGKGVLDPLWKLTGWSPFLWDLEVEVTTSCYLRCIHCEHTYWKDKTYLNQNLKLGTFVKLLEGIPNLKWINITGEGTAVLNPDFFEMVHYIKSKGIYLDFSHDFFRLTHEQMLNLIKWGVDRIYWSIDGVTKETYEKIRVGSNFEQVCKNVGDLIKEKKFLKSPLPEVCFRFAFFKDNINEVEYIPDFLASIASARDFGDEPSINIVALLEFQDTKGWEVEISTEVVERTNKRAKKLGFKIYWSHVTHIESEKPPLDYCTFWSEPYIMITGDVVPCCAVLMSNNRDQLEELSFGNINQHSLKEIWNTRRYREFRKTVVDSKRGCPKVCEGCRVFNTKERIGR